MQLLVKTASYHLDNSSIAFKPVQAIQGWCGGFWFGLRLLIGEGEGRKIFENESVLRTSEDSLFSFLCHHLHFLLQK